ncbi:hypothetical protein DFR86_04090 [Acidianus sulfidivorans JP7]|uniref:Blue (type 1) copper domain-containing protein n=1 Tax=Acidianus sulfidivorans JP7 TaxID=619593 RepID=A0A2U9ILD0_9CREN|nr:plastocyanin/azurin family copper-binding protein [Acidianus sulfidivorans]AWR96817.1 hypothetical protein DFR86_04090 [Acidianus sulfidivorans JP7]
MRHLIFLIVILGVLIAGIVTYAYFNVYLPSQYNQESVNYYNEQLNNYGYYNGGYYGGGMMGGGRGMGMYHMMGYYNGYETIYEESIPVSQAISEMRSPPSYAKIFANNDTIVFNSENINIIVLSMGHNRAVNLTGMTPPPYANHNVYVIYGLINPTLIIPQGASVTFTLINLDAGDYHNLAITPISPPYSYYVMMQIRMNVLGVTPMLPPANYQSGIAYDFSFVIHFYSSGYYYYLCEYPGHAEMGMYGKIIVVQ